MVCFFYSGIVIINVPTQIYSRTEMPFRFTRRNEIAPFPNATDGERRTKATTTILQAHTYTNECMIIYYFMRNS